MVVMGCLATDHATQRHITVVAGAGFGRHCDRGGNLEGAGNGNDLAGDTGFGDSAFRAAPQIGGDMFIEKRLDEQLMRRLGAHAVVLSSASAPSRRAT